MVGLGGRRALSCERWKIKLITMELIMTDTSLLELRKICFLFIDNLFGICFQTFINMKSCDARYSTPLNPGK
jgi:hypothetical protein